MTEQSIAIPEEAENDNHTKNGNDNDDINNNNEESGRLMAKRKERRKAAKKEKRKQKRRELAELERRDEEAQLNDPVVQLQLQVEEEREKERAERERKEFEEREMMLLEAWERKRAQEAEEEERRKALEEEEKLKKSQVGYEDEVDEDGWEYVEEGPPEIIWQGNEIIVKKKKVRVKKNNTDLQIVKELQDPNRPTSNPLPPQSEAFADYKNEPILSAKQILENVAQQTPNFGTEQDKAHCPFHLKTGACRFGSSCSRIHFYPDKSCTLLIKNMYNGPGLSWEQDEGLEYTDEEIERAYEEFYEDVHTEFLKFGELVNFKVQCEYVGLTRWKIAICGEFMKLKLKSCSRGTACNFIHCFRNPGGDYEWADWDKPPPKFWVKKMVALFGYSDESGYNKQTENESPRLHCNSGRMSTYDEDRYHYQRSQSREIDYSRRISRKYSDEYDIGRSAPRFRHGSADKKRPEILEEKHCKGTSSSRKTPCGKFPFSDYDSDRDRLGRDSGRSGLFDSSSKNSRHHRNGKLEYQGDQSDKQSTEETDFNVNLSDWDRDKGSHLAHERKSRRHGKRRSGILDKDCSRDWLDDNRDTTMCRSDTMRSTRRHDVLDDRWDDRSRNYDNELNGDCCDDHGASAMTAIESEDAESDAQKAHKKHSNCGDKRKSDSYDRNYKYSDSNSDSSSGPLRSEKRFPKKSIGKQDTDKNSDSESPVQYPEEKESHTYYGEDVDKRGRWEPDEGIF
ncbi:zinc finger CCCH domain-containing protein 5 isoform X4 [Olea europaea var. sylvestris]|uniref:zinc finger CCCH domain-containing protein 5 isoform X4 n=1 Tax=Olea europaea var. sylvestris TaxID=158386 RepID=UPI000C1CDA49|nr:zinc finger CCCH domain-containing protein 5 isoform X4 [Olea europaea var. sylvestris]